MPISVKKGESQKQFVARCMKVEALSDRPSKQSLAICFDTFRKRKK